MRTRREFTLADRIAIVGRATDSSGKVFCERCGIWVKSRKGYEFHHLVPEAMRPVADMARKLTPADGRLWCLKCHGEETPRNLADIGKAKRLEAAHVGVKPPPRRKINWGHEREEKPALKVAAGRPRIAREYGQ